MTVRNIPGLTEIKIPAQDLQNLLAMTKWYSEMPSIEDGDVGDSFHQNVREYQDNRWVISDDLAEILDNDGWYLSHYEFDADSNTVFAVFDQDGCDIGGEDVEDEPPQPYVYVPFVAEN